MLTSANAMLPELLKGKQVKICVGAGVTPDNVWAAVESKTLEKGLRGTEHTLESISKHYAAAARCELLQVFKKILRQLALGHIVYDDR